MSKTVLIADDGAEMRKLTRKVIETIPGSLVCVEAVDGLEALEKSRELALDLVILDLSMPRLNGLDAARALRSAGSRVPIILFTLHRDSISLLQASEAGIDAIVAKVGDLDVLVNQVKRLLAAA
jgi:two-component system response regulator MprA